MSEIRCERCGGVVEGKNYFTYCSYKKCFIHVQCEQVCENYSAEMLPNGTHCKKRYSDELYKYRILSYRILAPDNDVQISKDKYQSLDTAILYDKFRDSIKRYNLIPRDEKDRRLAWRIELAAMQQVLRKRELENPKLSLWARRFFDKVGETKDD